MTRRHRAALAAALLAASGLACAQAPRSGGGGDSQLMGQLQQLASERADLQSQNAALKQQLDELKKKADASSSQGASAQQKVRDLQQEVLRQSAAGKEAAAASEKLRIALQQLIDRYRETAQALKDTETERDGLRGQVSAADRSLHTCVDRNAGLYFLANDILDRYEKRGFWSSLAREDPFTQISRVRLENLVDEYRQRVEEMRVERNKAASAPGNVPTPSAAAH